MALNLGLTDNAKKDTTVIFNQILADLHVLYIKYRNYHWNIKGPNFLTLHQLFETDYDALALQIDEFAERIKMLGGFATGSMTEFVKMSNLKEDTNKNVKQNDMVSNLADDNEALIKYVRENIEKVASHDDQVSEDMLIALMQLLSKQAWMLRAHLEA